MNSTSVTLHLDNAQFLVTFDLGGIHVFLYNSLRLYVALSHEDSELLRTTVTFLTLAPLNLL